MVAKLGQNIGLYCLSEHNDSILMWTHYAAEHSGYCLEFEVADNFNAAQQVKYATKFPVVDVFTTPLKEQVDLVFLTKFQGWSYEREWRIVDIKRGSGPREYPRELLRSVIFGLKMQETEREKIRVWVKKRGHSVRFFQEQQDNQQFKIVIKEIS